MRQRPDITSENRPIQRLRAPVGIGFIEITSRSHAFRLRPATIQPTLEFPPPTTRRSRTCCL